MYSVKEIRENYKGFSDSEIENIARNESKGLRKEVLGILKQEIEKHLLFGYWDKEWVEEKLNSVELILDYHFGGFGKIKPELIKFIDWIYTETGIRFDLLYNGKMLFAIYDLCKRGFFKSGQNIMIIHN